MATVDKLRPYQLDAFNAVMQWVKKTSDPCLIEAATGAGKSWIIAAIAEAIHRASGKRVLCLAPNADLLKQNREKFLTTGMPASIYSASAGKKCLAHSVVFATPGTFKKVASRQGGLFAAVIIDECHSITPTIKGIIKEMRTGNSNLRVIGLTATPYRLGEGYIYHSDENGSINSNSTARSPYFLKKVFTINARELIATGFLSNPIIGKPVSEGYDTSLLELDKLGNWSSESVDRAFVGHGRKTADIVADVVAQSAERAGVMLFAATVAHAAEILDSLPPDISRMIGGDTNMAREARRKIVADFKARKYKYLVSVQTMTTGVDFTHVDVIAILRATESVALLQQIIGRGLRIEQGKTDCLVLDYAENINRHCPDGDIFNPEITAKKTGSTAGVIMAVCPECSCTNEFTAAINPSGYDIDENGYFISHQNGLRVKSEWGDTPAHQGRRCEGSVLNRKTGRHERCDFRWTYKKCHKCGTKNDISARACSGCGSELVDPNKKLTDIAAATVAPAVRTLQIAFMTTEKMLNKNGDECLKVKFFPKDGAHSAQVWVQPWAMKDFMAATAGGAVPPEAIAVIKNKNGFDEIESYG